LSAFLLQTLLLGLCGVFTFRYRLPHFIRVVKGTDESYHGEERQQNQY
jgi:hypothetical protein